MRDSFWWHYPLVEEKVAILCGDRIGKVHIAPHLVQYGGYPCMVDETVISHSECTYSKAIAKSGEVLLESILIVCGCVFFQCLTFFVENAHL